MPTVAPDLFDAIYAVLPHADPTEEARQIVGVMARISRAASASLLVERDGALHWLTGDRLAIDTTTTIRSAWKSQRRRLLSGTTITEAPVPVRRPVRTWLMWIRRPGDAGLDAVYFAGSNLRPLSACASPLARLAALLVRVRTPARKADAIGTEIDYARGRG
jgi:hypothetical protein